MLYANAVIPIVLLIVCFMAFPLLVQWYVRRTSSGKHLCAILSKGQPLQFKMLKVVDDDFVKDGADQWTLKDNLMKPVSYPISWPRILDGFRRDVWCSLVMRGRSDPLDWENPPAGALSSKELPVILDPHWLINLVRGVGEGGGRGLGRLERMMIFLAVGLSGICMILLFVVLFRTGGA